ncbi:hypothetical protein ACRALDRAFT_1074794 [Sodiomyces alcalophilus JCM 7366]|uniref:uncharacterized protein n=1 Tax=Sodiomyces alcalophilus JCM 7366 TaxID=591952 RepID=UPI0039B5BA5C
MTSWFTKGRPALFDALAAVCDQIDIDLLADLREKDRVHEERISTDIAGLRRQIDELRIIKSENRTLREKLAQLQKTGVLPGDDGAHGRDVHSEEHKQHDTRPGDTLVAAPNAPAPGTLPNADDWNDLLRKSHVLQRKYDKLNSNFKSLRNAYKEKKEALERFQRCDRCLEETARSAKRRHGQRSGGFAADNDPSDLPRSVRPSNSRSRASSEIPLGGSVRDATAHLSFSSDVGPRSRSYDDVPTAVPARRDASPAVTPTIRKEDSENKGDMESTQGESTYAADEDDVRLPPLPRAAADPPSAIAIKSEPSSDGPVIVSERPVRKRKAPDDRKLPPLRRVKAESSSSDSDLGAKQIGQIPHDSMDLDETSHILNTPRKNRFFDSTLSNAPGPAPLQFQTTGMVSVRSDLTDQPGRRPTADSSVLAPISSNIRAPGPDSADTKPFKKKGLKEGIESLAEDGGPYRKRPIRGPSMQSPAENSRLDKLLNTPATREGPTSVRSAPPTRNTSGSLLPGLGPPQRRKLPFGEDRRGRSKDSPLRRAEDDGEAGGSKPATGVKPFRQANQQAERPRPGVLRSKSPSRLRLDDFKVNPKYTSGLDYAFSEVVRGKNDRACLSGCVDMNCCGKKFRALAMAQRSNTERNAAEDMRLYEEFLGDSISRIWGMSPAEKEELWLEAKTWKLANQLGKHRHHYSRRPSPPGFWDTEFPDTQAIAAEKAEAEKQEKQTIQERYREAMRPGGRWVFRDE